MYRLCRYLDPVTLTCISCSSDFDTFYVDVRYLLNYKAYSHQTLHSTSSGCTDSVDTLTWWPWPIFCTAVTLTDFTSTFDISSTVRPNHQTLHSASSWCTELAGTLTWWPWPIFHTPVTLTHFTLTFDVSSAIMPTATIPCIVLSSIYWLGRYLDPVTLTYISSSSDFCTFYVDVPLSLSSIIQKVSAAYCAEDIAIRGNGTGQEYLCPTGHFVYIFF